ncbi:hypothetical protein CEXT_37221 [Caerostris extrusa]|uniref:Uncharacterized protein n=1 Tax=Caerostris extrusa TaxID=172846 RepID=A0AAV4Y571_CAEEX|nr:hypothetical protein CEXT_37221 [Caerostris extrusa]
MARNLAFPFTTGHKTQLHESNSISISARGTLDKKCLGFIHISIPDRKLLLRVARKGQADAGIITSAVIAAPNFLA